MRLLFSTIMLKAKWKPQSNLLLPLLYRHALAILVTRPFSLQACLVAWRTVESNSSILRSPV